jgi:glutaredoxin-like protein NrdH
LTRVTLYSLPASVCVACRFTKRKMDELGIAYDEVPLGSNPDALAHIKQLGYTSAPVVEASYGEDVTLSWSGYAPTKIEQLKATLG